MFWSYDMHTIREKLQKWYNKWKGMHDATIESELFTTETEGAVTQQIKNACWVEDKLNRNSLYQAIAPGKKSKTNLPTFVGGRGAESKIEKAHHIILHACSIGMGQLLADSLGMAGVTRYNRNIQYRLWIAGLDPTERASIPARRGKIPKVVTWGRTGKQILAGHSSAARLHSKMDR